MASDTRPKYQISWARFLNFPLVIESRDFKVCQKSTLSDLNETQYDVRCWWDIHGDDFQGHPRSGSRSWDDLSPLSGQTIFSIKFNKYWSVSIIFGRENLESLQCSQQQFYTVYLSAVRQTRPHSDAAAVGLSKVSNVIQSGLCLSFCCQFFHRPVSSKSYKKA